MKNHEGLSQAIMVATTNGHSHILHISVGADGMQYSQGKCMCSASKLVLLVDL